MTMGQFPTLTAAIEHAKRMGGWIAHTFDGVVYWFDCSWGMTRIMLHPCLHGQNALIAPWSSHEEILKAKGVPA